MNRLAFPLLAGAFLAASAGLALAAVQPMQATPAAGGSAGGRMTAALNLLEAKGMVISPISRPTAAISPPP